MLQSTDRKLRIRSSCKKQLSLCWALMWHIYVTLHNKANVGGKEKKVHSCHSGWRCADLIRLCVHQVNNELCIILLSWCSHNNGDRPIPNKPVRGMKISAFSDFQKSCHLLTRVRSMTQTHTDNPRYSPCMTLTQVPLKCPHFQKLIEARIRNALHVVFLQRVCSTNCFVLWPLLIESKNGPLDGN